MGVMAGGGQRGFDASIFSLYLDSKARFEIFMALLLALPLYPWLRRLKQALLQRWSGAFKLAVSAFVHLAQLLFFATISYFAVISLAAGVYNPFIYFRF